MGAEDIFSLINQRLGYMEDVAVFKAVNNIAVADIQREALVIERAKQAAYEQGLRPHSIEDFFRAQITVAKAIQYRHRAELLTLPHAGPPVDLNETIRPQLIRLGDEIILQIANYVKAHGAFKPVTYGTFDAAITVGNVNQREKRLLFDTLMQVKPRAAP